MFFSLIISILTCNLRNDNNFDFAFLSKTLFYTFGKTAVELSKSLMQLTVHLLLTQAD